MRSKNKENSMRDNRRKMSQRSKSNKNLHKRETIQSEVGSCTTKILRKTIETVFKMQI